MKRHPPVTPPEGAHRYTVRAYYEDTDAGGVVYHASYLRFAERARTEALRDLGVPHAEMTTLAGLIFMVRRVKVDYLAPARVDEVLVITTWPLAIGAARVDLHQRVTHAGAASAGALAELEVRLACVRLTDMRAARIPPRWRDALATLAETG